MIGMGGLAYYVLPENEQQCLIKNTLNAKLEVNTINELLKSKKSINIIVYGKNACRILMSKKQKQLISLGFYNVFTIMVDYLNGYFFKIYMGEMSFQQQVTN